MRDFLIKFSAFLCLPIAVATAQDASPTFEQTAITIPTTSPEMTSHINFSSIQDLAEKLGDAKASTTTTSAWYGCGVGNTLNNWADHEGRNAFTEDAVNGGTLSMFGRSGVGGEWQGFIITPTAEQKATRFDFTCSLPSFSGNSYLVGFGLYNTATSSITLFSGNSYTGPTGVALTLVPTATTVYDKIIVVIRGPGGTAVEKYSITNVSLNYMTSTTYTATVDSDTAWSEISWTASTGSETVTSLPADAVAELTVSNSPTITFSAPETDFLTSMTVTGAATFAFDVSEQAKLATAGTPYRFPLITAGAFAATDLTVTPLLPSGYKGTATVTSGGVDVVVTAPTIAKTRSININFPGGRGSSTSDGSKVTVAPYDAMMHGAYPVQGSNWNEIAAANASAAKDLLLVAKDGTTSTQSVNVTLEGIQNPYTLNADDTVVDQLFFGYCDDGSSPKVTLTDIPFAKYRVVVYFTTDTDNRAFEPSTINDVSYCGPSTGKTGGLTVKGTAVWGDSMACRTADIGVVKEGVNYLVSDVITDATVTVQNKNLDGQARGGLAALQVIEVGIEVVPVFDYTADISGTATWAAKSGFANESRTWENSATNLITLTSTTANTSLTFDEDVTAASITATGTGILVFNKNDDVTLTVPSYDFSALNGGISLGFDLGSSTVSVPASGVFERAYTMPASTIFEYSGANVRTNRYSAGGFGVFATPNGGVLELAGGTFTITNMPNSAIATTLNVFGTEANPTVINFPTDSTSLNSSLDLGSMTVNVGSNVTINTTRFTLSDGNNGRSSVLNQTGGAINVTGSSNVDSNAASIMLGHWNGSSTYSMRGGSFTALNAWVLIGKTANTHDWMIGGGATAKVKGVRWSNGATGTATVRVVGGRLEVGSLGVEHGSGTGTRTLTLNGGTLAAYESFSSSKTINNYASGRLEATDGVTMTLTGVISTASGGAGGLTKGGAGLVTLSAANTYAGATTIEAGTVKLGNVRGFSGGAVTLKTGGTLDLTEFTLTDSATVIANGVAFASDSDVPGNAKIIVKLTNEQRRSSTPLKVVTASLIENITVEVQATTGEKYSEKVYTVAIVDGVVTITPKTVIQDGTDPLSIAAESFILESIPDTTASDVASVSVTATTKTDSSFGKTQSAETAYVLGITPQFDAVVGEGGVLNATVKYEFGITKMTPTSANTVNFEAQIIVETGSIANADDVGSIRLVGSEDGVTWSPDLTANSTSSELVGNTLTVTFTGVDIGQKTKFKVICSK